MQRNALRKHVSLIHAHSKMSLLQRKTFNFLLTIASKGKVEDLSQNGLIDCRTTLKQLKDAINFTSRDTKYLKEAIDSLASLSIEWNVLMDKLPSNISFMNLRILHGPPIFFKDGSLEFSFHKYIFKLVGNPDIYGTIDMDCQSSFESKYSHALYENSTRILNMLNSKIISLPDFKRVLGICEDSYSSTKDFNKKIIKPALEEVNDRSNFVVTLDKIIEGRSVKAFEVSVADKKKITSPSNKKPQLKEPIVETIKQAFGQVSERTLNFVVASYCSEYILEKIEYTIKHTKKEVSGNYPIKYFISALKEDYKISVVTEGKEPTESEEEKVIKEWLFELKKLKLDEHHWKKVLSRSKEGNSKDLVIKILDDCKKKVKGHLTQDPR